MALVEQKTYGVDANLGCGFVNANYNVTAYLDAVSWGRDTGNASRSKLSFTANANLHYDTLVWAGTGDFSNNQIWCWTDQNTETTGNRTFPKGGSYCNNANGCCYCLCGGSDWWWSNRYGHFNGYVYGTASTTQVGISAQYLGVHTGNGYYNLPNNLRVLPPTGLSVTWPTNITGSASASISSWSSNANIGGTPTTYPGASYWNWAIDLLDENGNYLAHKTFNTGETKSKNFGSLNSGWYTASALSGSSAANGSPYTIQAGKKYKFRVYAKNNMNQQLSATSGVFVSSPPKPTISITSVVYNPTTKKGEMCFDWSLGASALTPETVTFKVTTPGGTKVASGTLKTISNGAAASGTKCNIVVPTGEQLTLTVTNTAGPSGNTMTASSTATTYSPVANAAFLGFDWDELRRECTIRAEAPGAANCRIEAGYAANNYNIGNKLTTGEVGTLVVKDLNHGNGQILYLQATPESSNGYKYTKEIAKISIPIPNPILGVYTPDCDNQTAKQQYIVDIIEKKKTSCVVTPKWQNGDRVVKIDKCGPGGVVGAYDLQSGMCIENGVLKKGSWFSVKITDGLAAKVGSNPWGVGDGYSGSTAWAAIIQSSSKLTQVGNLLTFTVTADIVLPSYKFSGFSIHNGHVSGQPQNLLNIAATWDLKRSEEQNKNVFNSQSFGALVAYYKYENGEWVKDVQLHTFPFACS